MSDVIGLGWPHNNIHIMNTREVSNTTGMWNSLDLLLPSLFVIIYYKLPDTSKPYYPITQSITTKYHLSDTILHPSIRQYT